MNKSNKTQIAIRNVASVWRCAFSKAQSRVIVFSPYLTSTTVLRHVASPLSVYTEFSVELFASGASSFRVLREITEWEDTEVFWLPNLHAKIMIVDEDMLTIGSQNMTTRGERNLEATAIIRCSDQIARTSQTLEKWMERATPITLDLLHEMEPLIPPARKLFLAFQRQCEASQSKVNTLAEKLRLESSAAYQIQLERLKLIEVAREKLASEYKRVQTRIDLFFPKGHIKEEVAKKFVEKSVWWLTHISGPTRAPKAAKYVYYSRNLGYCWTYSKDSNKYMVERAIQNCIYKFKKILANSSVEKFSKDELINYIKVDLFNYVANCNDEQYSGHFGGIDGNDIKFGSSSIDVQDFAVCFLFYYCGLASLLESIDELKRLECTSAA